MVAIIGSAEEMQLIVKASITQLAGKINTLSSMLVGVSVGNVDDKVEYRQRAQEEKEAQLFWTC
jgi:hypothetical protein